MIDNYLADKQEAYRLALIEWQQKEQEMRQFLEDYFPVTTAPGPHNPARRGKVITAEVLEEFGRLESAEKSARLRWEEARRRYAQAAQQ